MKTKLVAFLSVIAGVVVLATVGWSAPPVSGPISLVGTVQEHHETIGTSRFPDRETWYLSLASARRKNGLFGYGLLACSFISRKTTVRQCSGTLSLPRGKIIVAGSFLYPILFQLAVVGGTDTYVNVSGSMQMRQFVKHPGSYWVAVTLH